MHPVAVQVYLTLLAVAAFLSTSANADTSTNDINALHFFYNSTDGYNWTWQGSGAQWVFNATADPCLDDWQGITCANCFYNSSVCNVTEIRLDNYNLRGVLSASLCDIANLTNISVASNALTSSVPPCLFSSLLKLNYLTLRHNSLNGTLQISPTETSFALQHLDLGENLLSGTLPSALGDYPALTFLSLYTNLVSGSFPAFLNQLSNLTHLGLQDNLFSGTVPSSFFPPLQLLGSLRFGGSLLTGTIASSLCDATALYALYFYNANFTGKHW